MEWIIFVLSFLLALTVFAAICFCVRYKNKAIAWQQLVKIKANYQSFKEGLSTLQGKNEQFLNTAFAGILRNALVIYLDAGKGPHAIYSKMGFVHNKRNMMDFVDAFFGPKFFEEAFHVQLEKIRNPLDLEALKEDLNWNEHEQLYVCLLNPYQLAFIRDQTGLDYQSLRDKNA